MAKCDCYLRHDRPSVHTEQIGSHRMEFHEIYISVFLRKYVEKTSASINLLKPTGHVMHQQFNIQQLYVLPTLYLCVLYLSENK